MGGVGEGSNWRTWAGLLQPEYARCIPCPVALGAMSTFGELARRLELTEALHRAFGQELQELRREVREVRLHPRSRGHGSGLEVVIDFVVQALGEAAFGDTNEDLKDDLQRFLQTSLPEVECDDAATRMVAYTRLRMLHRNCQTCKAKKASKTKTTTTCAVLRSMLLLRDLVILTVCQGHTSGGRANLHDVLHTELLMSSTQDLEPDELSQLTMAFNKICRLGQQRDGFDDAVRSDSMYGPGVTPAQLDQLFAAYSSGGRAFPGYVSKNKARGKVRKPRGSPTAEAPEQETPGQSSWEPALPAASPAS